MPSRDNPFAGRSYAEETQRSIDQEVAQLLRNAQSRATKLLQEIFGKLSQVIDLLLERETIDGSDLAAIAGAGNATRDQKRSGHPGRPPSETGSAPLHTGRSPRSADHRPACWK